jgi:hypothetical protein
LALASCHTGPHTPSQIATGVVISADGPDSTQVDSFSLRTNEGQVIQFKVGRLDLTGGGLPAPHLREHLLSGVPITVYYEVQDGANVATHYIDAQP